MAGRLLRLFSAACVIALLSGCPQTSPKELSRSEFAFGTECTIRLGGGGSETLLDAVFARLRQLEDELSADKPGSQIVAVNSAAGISPVAVGADALAIIRRDFDLSAWSEGAFDPSVGPLVKLWGIGTDHPRLPEPKEIAEAKSLGGREDIVLDESKGTIFLRRRGMALDLGPTSNGYAADELLNLIREAGVRSAMVDLGGVILVEGSRPDGKPWRIGLQDPFSTDKGAYLGIASLTDGTMATSSTYESYFLKDGKRYHHILDTKTGYPVDNGLMSVTVVATKAFDADGLAAAVFALGREKGMALARSKGVDAIVIDGDKKVFMSPGVSTYFEITDSSFSFAE